MVILSSFAASMIAAELFLPVFYRLNFTSVNQYLEQRFNSKNVRLAVSFSFLLCTVPYMGVVLYGPSLALETVTGLSVTASILIIGFICTLYTSIGGIKAVVWTDVVQVFLMFAGLFVVMIRVCMIHCHFAMCIIQFNHYLLTIGILSSRRYTKSI